MPCSAVKSSSLILLKSDNFNNLASTSALRAGALIPSSRQTPANFSYLDRSTSPRVTGQLEIVDFLLATAKSLNVRDGGVEPPHPKAPEPKSGASANSASPAHVGSILPVNRG
ncbi:MAG: hypothetical protein RL355_385 [Actinomycetota bacterium]